ncbi:MAG TPA: hypothetical protein VK129_09720, partial [Terriglobales bacterium]|nr:hypothetical protein [Terriglobales bacterium]
FKASHSTAFLFWVSANHIIAHFSLLLGARDSTGGATHSAITAASAQIVVRLTIIGFNLSHSNICVA